MLPSERRMTLRIKNTQKLRKQHDSRLDVYCRVLRCALETVHVSNKARHKDAQAPLADSIIPAAKRGARVRCVVRVRVWRDGAYLFSLLPQPWLFVRTKRLVLLRTVRTRLISGG